MDGFTFFKSYYESAQHLKIKDQQLFYKWILDYMFSGIEPESNSPLMGFWLLTKPTLDTSKARSKAKQKQIKTESKPKPSPLEDKDKDKDIEEEERWNFINEIKSQYSGIKFTVDDTDYYFHEDGLIKTWTGNHRLTTSKAMTLYKRMNKNRNAIMAHLQANKGQL